MMPRGKTLLMAVIKPSRETGRVPPWQGFSEVENQSPSLFKEEAQAAEKFVQPRAVLKKPLGCTSSGRETILPRFAWSWLSQPGLHWVSPLSSLWLWPVVSLTLRSQDSSPQTILPVSAGAPLRPASRMVVLVACGLRCSMTGNGAPVAWCPLFYLAPETRLHELYTVFPPFTIFLLTLAFIGSVPSSPLQVYHRGRTVDCKVCVLREWAESMKHMAGLPVWTFWSHRDNDPNSLPVLTF